MYRIDICTKSDIENIYNIENQLFKNPWSCEQFYKEIQNENTIFKVIHEDDLIIGYYIIAIIDYTCEIYKIAVNKTYQKRGFGSILMNHIFKTSEKKSINNFYLEVNETNYDAVNLYKKHNFLEVHRRKNYYGKESAIIMVKKLNENK